MLTYTRLQVQRADACVYDISGRNRCSGVPAPRVAVGRGGRWWTAPSPGGLCTAHACKFSICVYEVGQVVWQLGN